MFVRRDLVDADVSDTNLNIFSFLDFWTGSKYQIQVSFSGRLCEGKPTRMRRLCLKTSEAKGRGGLGITSSSEEVYELML